MPKLVEVRKGQIAIALANGVDPDRRGLLEVEYNRLEATEVELDSVPATTAIAQAQALTAKPKPDHLTSDQILKIFGDEQRARNQATVRAERTIDLEAWVEAAKRDVAELEEQGTEEWFTDMRRSELALAEKELKRREHLETPVDLSDKGQIDWQDLIVRVKEKARLVDLFEGYGVEMRKTGTLWKGCCPWHDDTTPSLVVRTIGQIDYYKCYGCGAHGDAISFIEQTRQLRFLEAVKWLTEDYFL